MSTGDVVTISERDAAKQIARAAEIAAEESTLTGEIAKLVERERAAVDAALREGKQARGPGTAAEVARRKREAAERRLEDLQNFEGPAARKIASEATAALRRAKLAAARAEARSFDALEEAAVQLIATGYEQFLRGYAALADAAEGREAVHAQLEAEGLLNDIPEAEKWPLQRAFQSTVQPFPASPDALVELIAPAILDQHVDADEFAQRHPVAALFAPLLEAVRQERLYRRCRLRLSDNHGARADFSSSTSDRAGGAAASRNPSDARVNRGLFEAVREAVQ